MRSPRDTDRTGSVHPFDDRTHAGRLLAEGLAEAGVEAGTVVLGLLRGGVPVAAEVARRFACPLGALAVRKIGMPGQPELARGAVTANGALALNDLAHRTPELEVAVARARAEAEAIEQRFRPPDGGPPVGGRSVILVDDGLATGATMRAAVAGVRLDGAVRITVAVPVGSASACSLLSREADRVVCVAVPSPFGAVGNWYRNFAQLGDDDVRSVLLPSGG